jgi:hypothetical protein
MMFLKVLWAIQYPCFVKLAFFSFVQRRREFFHEERLLFSFFKAVIWYGSDLDPGIRSLDFGSRSGSSRPDPVFWAVGLPR